jgi:hypothetical protein
MTGNHIYFLRGHFCPVNKRETFPTVESKFEIIDIFTCTFKRIEA